MSEVQYEQELMSVSAFQKLAPINLRYLIDRHHDELVENGVLYWYSPRKRLIDPKQFWVWLRKHSQVEL